MGQIEPETQINLMGPINDSLVAAMMQTMSNALNQGSRSFLIGISSPGGSVFSGVSAYNFLRGIRDVSIVTHNYGQVDSIAGVIFAAGDTRLCVPDARFLMHGVSLGFGQGAQLEEDQLREKLESLRNDTGTIARILAARTNKKAEEIRKVMLSRAVFGADEGKTLGLVHEIKAEVFDPSIGIINIHGQ